MADQKAKTTTWKEMYDLNHANHDRRRQMDRWLQEQQDAAEARELHWAANKHKKTRPSITGLKELIIQRLKNHLKVRLLQQ